MWCVVFFVSFLRSSPIINHHIQACGLRELMLVGVGIQLLAWGFNGGGQALAVGKHCVYL